MTSVAFLGLGTVGYAMARNVAKVATQLTVWNRTVEKAKAFVQEVPNTNYAETPEEAVKGADVVITVLGDTNSVKSTLSPTALNTMAKHKAVFLQMSTIGLDYEEIYQLAKKHGVLFVDAPFLGSKSAVEAGKVTLLVGVDEQDKAVVEAKCRPIWDILGSKTVFFSIGAASRFKLVLNSWVVGSQALMAETVAIAHRLQVPPENFFEAIKGTALDFPYAHLKRPLMLNHEYQPPAFALEMAQKDANLILAAADTNKDKPLRIMQAVAESYRRANELGHARDDMSSVLEALL
jgi:3-hydroxyisobutyrate dehydrogenase